LPNSPFHHKPAPIVYPEIERLAVRLDRAFAGRLAFPDDQLPRLHGEVETRTFEPADVPETVLRARVLLDGDEDDAGGKLRVETGGIEEESCLSGVRLPGKDDEVAGHVDDVKSPLIRGIQGDLSLFLFLM